MIEKILFLFVCAFLLCCGETETVSRPVDVSSIYNLGRCTKEREGEQAFVVDKNCLYTCKENDWVSENGEDKSSTSLKTLVSSDDSKKVESSCSSTDEQVDGESSSSKKSETWELDPSASSSSSIALSSSSVVIIDENEFLDTRDGHVYKTVKIGTRTWMAENLKYAYNEGKQSFCYLDREENCEYLGRLYTWSGAMAMEQKYDSTYKVEMKLPHQGVCPEGWHVSTEDDWSDLHAHVDFENGKESVGENLIDNVGWNVSNYQYGGTTVSMFDFNEANRNKYGFALRAGFRWYSGDYREAAISSLVWLATNNPFIEHVVMSVRGFVLDLVSCDYDDFFSYRDCLDENGGVTNNWDYRAKNYKSEGKFVRCVSDTFLPETISLVKTKTTAEGESEYDETAQTLLDKRDGQVYKTTKIGEQVWMAENLNFKTSGGNADDLEGSLCLENKAENCEEFGRLYNWNAAMDIPQEYESARYLVLEDSRQGICPGGWHLPQDQEWQQMIDFVKADYDEESFLDALQDEPYPNTYGLSLPLPTSGFATMKAKGNDVAKSKYFYFWTSSNSAEMFLVLARGYNGVDMEHGKPRSPKQTFAAVRCIMD